MVCTLIVKDICHHSGQSVVNPWRTAIVWHIDVSSFVCTLTDNSELVYQIATLLPIVIK